MSDSRMNKKERKETGARKKAWDEAMKAPRECLRPGCRNRAISSHWLQQSMLKNIAAEDGHLIQWNPAIAFEVNELARRSAKKSAAMWFPGFCDSCDKEVFSMVENQTPDFNNFGHQLLFSYRSLLNSLRRNEMIRNAGIIATRSNNDIPLRFKKAIEANKKHDILHIMALRYYKYLFEKEIYPLYNLERANESDSQFEIFHVTMPKIEVAASFALGAMQFPQFSYAEIIRLDHTRLDEIAQLSNFFGTLIPTESALEVIICWKKGFVSGTNDYLPPLNILQSMNHQEISKMISDFLVGGAYNWAISDNLHSFLKSSGADEELVKLKEINMDRAFSSLPVDYGNFNMFNGLI